MNNKFLRQTSSDFISRWNGWLVYSVHEKT